MTPDQDLSARLPCGCCGAMQPLSAYANDPVVMVITLADHERAVQAAVAKAVEAERAACADVAVNRHWHWSKLGNACLVDDDASACADIAVAIRARKGDAL